MIAACGKSPTRKAPAKQSLTVSGRIDSLQIFVSHIIAHENKQKRSNIRHSREGFEASIGQRGKISEYYQSRHRLKQFRIT